MFLNSNIFNAISLKTPVKLPLSYWILVLLRFLLTLIPQSGYIHPDEFFQNVEVMAGDIFTIDVARTWEFDPKFPIRNIFVPKIIFGPPLHFIRLANPYIKYFFKIDLKTPYFLLTLPRLFICILSLINDYCLYRTCVIYGQNFRNRLTIFASSYVVLVYCCRSFSNTFEMLFFSLLLTIVAECMFRSDKVIHHTEFLQQKYNRSKDPVERVKIFKLQTHLPEHSLNYVVIISSIIAMGIFNRPTFIGFAFAPIFFWLHRGLGSKVVGFKDFHYRIGILIICSAPIVFILIAIDSSYYGYLTIADIESNKISWDNWVVTPLNFLRYNSDMKNLNQHGLHPHWLHLVGNIPLLFNVLGILVYVIIIIQIYRFIRGQYSKLPRVQSITGLMLFSLVTPVAVLSLFPHQEARFIIPILIPLVYLYGNYLYPNESNETKMRHLKTIVRCSWYLCNICMVIFFGFIHQGGIYPFTRDLHKEIKSTYGVRTYVITTHSYSIPSYLLQLESTTTEWMDRKTGHHYRLMPTTFLYKYGSMPTVELFNKANDLLSNAESHSRAHKWSYRFYIVSPCSLDNEIREEASNYFYIDLAEDRSYYPHFCSEAFPSFPERHDQLCLLDQFLNQRNESQTVNLNIYERVSCFLKKFCLKIYRVRSKDIT